MTVNRHYLYTDISGNEVCVNSYTYGEGSEGLYIQGGVHGGEVTFFIFAELHKFLKENESKLKKKITLVPVANPTAWNQRVYYYTVGKFDLYKGSDWNRSYPGGETTLSARNSEMLFSIASKYQLVIDLHTARSSSPYVIFMDDKVKKYVKAFGLPYNYFINLSQDSEGKFKGTLNQALLERGVDSLTCECGSHDEHNAKNVQEVYGGILRTLVTLGVVADLVDDKVDFQQYVTKKVSVIYSSNSGFVKYHLQPQDEFKKGDVLCTILSSSDLGREVRVEAPFDGVMFELARTHITWVGDELLRLISKSTLETLN